jgi:hypothetical protein
MYGDKKLLTKEDYLKAINQLLTERYCITFNDTGYEDTEWLARFGDLDVEEAVEAYAEKYALTSMDSCLQ